MKPRFIAPMMAAISLFAAGANANAADDKLIPGGFSATAALTTDYRFRGISQTKNKPAIQGSFDYELAPFKEAPLKDVKLFAGVWGSNVDFNDGDQAQAELDFYGGFSGSVDKFSWKLQFTYYYYPGAASRLNYNYVEINPSFGYDFGFVSPTVGVSISPDYFGSSGVGVYVYGDAGIPLPIKPLAKYKPALNLHIGYQSIEQNAVFGTPDYYDWNVGLSFEVVGFTLSVKYVDTSLTQSNCFGGSNICNATGVFTVSRTF